jgi:hypothetical protein
LTTSLGNTNANLANIASNVTTLQGQVYANANVAAYLPTYTGNLAGNNLVLTGSANVTGNLNVLGNVNYNNVQDLVVGDPIIIVGSNNTSNLVDLGLTGLFDNGTAQYTGLVRDHTDSTWKLFSNVTTLPGATVNFANAVYDQFKVGNISSTGNVTAGFFIGDGSQLINLPLGGYSNANVANYLASFGSNTISTTGNITAGNYIGTNAFMQLNSSMSVTALVNGNPIQVITVTGNNDASDSVAVGLSASAANGTVAVGPSALGIGPGVRAVAVGYQAGLWNAGSNSVAIGTNAGTSSITGTKLGANSVVIGAGAALGGSAANVIVLNATGANFTPSTSQASSFYVNPVRNDTGNVTNVMYYNTTTKEVTYGPGGSSYGNANVAAYLPTYNGNLQGSNVNVTNTLYIGGTPFTRTLTVGTRSSPVTVPMASNNSFNVIGRTGNVVVYTT